MPASQPGKERIIDIGERTNERTNERVLQEGRKEERESASQLFSPFGTCRRIEECISTAVHIQGALSLLRMQEIAASSSSSVVCTRLFSRLGFRGLLPPKENPASFSMTAYHTLRQTRMYTYGIHALSLAIHFGEPQRENGCLSVSHFWNKSGARHRKSFFVKKKNRKNCGKWFM